MVRSTARLLIVVMLLASGRLLACGLECLDEQPVKAEQSCHQAPVSAPTVGGEAAHACLPDATEPRVIVVKLATDQLTMAPLAAQVVAPGERPGRMLFEQNALRLLVELPPQPGAVVLRI